MNASARELLDTVLNRALGELEADPIPIYTFALYHDHESGAVSVCVDTEQNSQATVGSINRYNAKHFLSNVNAGDLKGAALWQANIGRSLSLGDFKRVNVARTPLGRVPVENTFYLEMVRALCAIAPRVTALSSDPSRLVFAASGEQDEVAYVWSVQADA